MMKLIDKAVAPARQAIRNMVARGILQIVNDAANRQGVQITLLADETRELQRFQNYGMTAAPPIGSECVALFLNGNRDHGVVLAIEAGAARQAAIANAAAQTGVAIQPEDVLLYTSNENFILLRASGNVLIHSPESIRLSGKEVQIHAEEQLKLDCLGNGFHWTPLTRTDYITGVTPSAVAIAPPEIPPPPAT